jgi:hypothetical protein
MGTVADRSRMTHVKSILLVEMIAQTLKKIFFCNTEYDIPNMKDNLIDFLKWSIPTFKVIMTTKLKLIRQMYLGEGCFIPFATILALT